MDGHSGRHPQGDGGTGGEAWDEQLETRHLFQRLSLLLVRGNAALLVIRAPDGDTLEGAIDGQE